MPPFVDIIPSAFGVASWRTIYICRARITCGTRLGRSSVLISPTDSIIYPMAQCFDRAAMLTLHKTPPHICRLIIHYLLTLRPDLELAVRSCISKQWL